MSDLKKTTWNGSRISRRRMLSYGLACMAGVAGGIWPASAFGDTNIMHGAKTGGRSMVFSGTFTGGAIAIYTAYGQDKRYPPMKLVEVQEKDLPADFPKDLVRWIP